MPEKGRGLSEFPQPQGLFWTACNQGRKIPGVKASLLSESEISWGPSTVITGKGCADTDDSGGEGVSGLPQHHPHIYFLKRTVTPYLDRRCHPNVGS